jgi:hypothetical protein
LYSNIELVCAENSKQELESWNVKVGICQQKLENFTVKIILPKKNNHQVTAVWRDWGFSGISVFLLLLR